MEDEDEVDVLGDFCLNLETDLNQYDAGEFPSQNTELLGDYMQHPWLLDNSQTWYFDQNNEEKNKTVLDNMLHEEKKHFHNTSQPGNPIGTLPVVPSKVSPIWTKDDIASLKKGIALHNQNWSKVARAVGTKTTLQVKSYIKSHPELIASVGVTQNSTTPPPPQYIQEVEVENEEAVVHFTDGDIVNETEIPAASMEEVIASVTTTTLSWASLKKEKKQVKPRVRVKKESREKSAHIFKKTPGRPKKANNLAQLNYSILPEERPPALVVKKPIPVLEGEIVRIQRPSEEVDSMSDSEIDIDGSDDEGIKPVPESPIPEPAKSPTKSPTKVAEPPDMLPLATTNMVFTENVDVPPPAFSLEIECKSEYESASESDSKSSKDKCSLDSEPPQPVFTFPTPTEERFIDLTQVTDEEKTVHWDFFEGRSSKTPERYLKIRNCIVQEWKRVKPKYLTKTSVRPTLKNCGDVNCISRVHAYLELTGVINFGCEQVQYNRPLPPVPSHRERLANSGSQHAQHHPLSFNLSVRQRKKRPLLSENGDENGGYTIRHDGTDVEVVRFAENSRIKEKKKARLQKDDNNPFKLMPCASFGSERPAPFQVKLGVEALLVVDIHAHLCTTEVIGLLGGRFIAGEFRPTLLIEAAQPCRSQATNHQCEMCPVSQTEASEELRARGLEVVGWYHSHPTFPALPSLRDLNTQNEFQEWFSRQDAPFVGIIVNPFNSSGIKASMSPKSIIRCITVHDEKPYKHEVILESEPRKLQAVKNTLEVLEESLSACQSMVPLDSKYPYPCVRSDNGTVNYARKAILSVRAHLEKLTPSDVLAEVEGIAYDFLNRLIERHSTKVTVVAMPATEPDFKDLN